MTWQICTWTLSSQQIVLHDYQESRYINFPASFRAQTKHYETKMSNPMYQLKNFCHIQLLAKYMFKGLLVPIENVSLLCESEWHKTISSKWGAIFSPMKYQPSTANGSDEFRKRKRNFNIYFQTVLLTFWSWKQWKLYT